jgi:hypothetical protein
MSKPVFIIDCLRDGEVRRMVSYWSKIDDLDALTEFIRFTSTVLTLLCFSLLIFIFRCGFSDLCDSKDHIISLFPFHSLVIFGLSFGSRIHDNGSLIAAVKSMDERNLVEFGCRVYRFRVIVSSNGGVKTQEHHSTECSPNVSSEDCGDAVSNQLRMPAKCLPVLHPSN